MLGYRRIQLGGLRPTRHPPGPQLARRARQVGIAEYLEAILADGDERAIPVGLRTVADAIGGMTALAEKAGLSREAARTLEARVHADPGRRLNYAGRYWIHVLCSR